MRFNSIFISMMCAMNTFAAAAMICCAAAAPPPAGFQPPVAGLAAEGADLLPPATVADAAACAARCIAVPGCISFNLCGGTQCAVSGYSMNYTSTVAPSCEWYRRSAPRNDAPAPRALTWALEVPAAGTVTLDSGPIAAAFYENVVSYLGVRSVDDMLFWFRSRAGDKAPPGQCFGWGGWIKGSEAGNFMMGAGSALQWTANATLRAALAAVVAGIRAAQDPADGYLWAANQSEMLNINMPDYAASWMTRGLLDADRAGVPDALAIARESVSFFNNYSLLPFILPPDGGPDYVPGQFPVDYDNATFGGWGRNTGHLIYIQFQGMIKHTLMALSPAGTQADVDIVADLYQEDWWLRALIARDPYHAVWHRTFFSHNYEVTAFEAFLDMFVLTGNATYRDAVQGAWDMMAGHWILPGGSFAVNEGSLYPPDSYYIGFTGTHIGAAHGHAHTHGHGGELEGAGGEGDPYYHSPCMYQPGAEGGEEEPARMSASAAVPAPASASSDPPTGELCGSVFWALLNQRLHRLEPANDTYVAEMERSIVNVALAAQGHVGAGGAGPGGTGIRYFANQHKVKQLPSMHASCCEGQGTRLFGALPGLLFSLQGQSRVLVDIYAQATLRAPPPPGCPSTVTVSVQTAWPYGAGVRISLASAGGACATFELALRMPAWLPAPASVAVDGAPGAATGVPGRYLVLTGLLAGAAGAATVDFNLTMAPAAVPYTGATQPPLGCGARFAFLVGPVLLSVRGPWNATMDALALPAGVNPSRPADWLVPAAGGGPLHFDVRGAPGYSLLPYFEVGSGADEPLFTNYPCFPAAVDAAAARV